MRAELFYAVREATEGEFDLLGQIDGGDSFIAYLARGTAEDTLAILVLRDAQQGGEFDLEEVRRLDATAALGWTRCHACNMETEGWPRLCGACGRDVSGVEGDEGGSGADLLEAVREAAEGEFEVLGSMARAEGGGEVYFARESATGRIVGLSLLLDPDGEYALELSWSAEGGEQPPPPGIAAEDGYGDVGLQPPPAPEPWQEPLPPPAAFGGDDALPPPHEPPAVLAAAAREEPGRSQDRRVRLGIYALAGVLVVGAAAILVASGGEPGTEPLVVAPVDTAAGGVVAAVRETPPAASRPEPSPASTPRPARREPAPRPAVPAERVSVTPGAGTVTAPPAETRPEEPAPAATDEAGIAAALARYAAAVGSRRTSQIRLAYPGITPAEVERWERFFQPLDAAAGLRARYVVERGPEVQGSVATVIFTLTLSYRDASGSPVEMPLPMRGVLARSGTEWRLEEVRSL